MNFDTSLLEHRANDGSAPLLEQYHEASLLGRAARAAGKPMAVNPFWNTKDDLELAAHRRWNDAWMAEHIRMIKENIPEPEPLQIPAA